MKKLIRVIIAVFCLFFALQAAPVSYLHAISRYTKEIPAYMYDVTLRLAGFIDTLTGGGTSSDESPAAARDSGATEDTDTDTDTDTDNDMEMKDTPEESPDNPEGNAGEAPEDDTDAGSRGSAEERGEKNNQQVTQEESAASELYYYYTRISKDERLLYDAMLSLAMNYGTEEPVSESRLLETDPSADAFAESYIRAYNALIRDHPELFWIAQTRAEYECRYYLAPSFGGQYKVVLSLADASGQETSGEGGASIFLEQQARMEEAADAMLEQVDFTQSDAGIALQIHDLLIDYAWYNTDADIYDYAHTAYGALVEDSTGNAGGALCDGYALAYEYLMQKAGITCIVVSGHAGPAEENTEKHAWNLVKLDDDWYEVDATWDDLDFRPSPSEEGYGLFLEALSDADYMSRIRHYMFNLTTEKMRSFTPGDEFTYFSDNGWVTLLQPSVHIRFTADESELTRDYVTPLAPVAEGTWYTWEMLTGHE